MYQRNIYFIILLLIAVACGKAPQPEQDTTAPSVPSGLNAVTNDDTVTLTWVANSEEDLKHYTVYQGTISGNLSEVDTIAAGTESFSAVGLEPGTYYFAISAEDSSGNASSQSPEVSATLETADETAPTGVATLPADGDTDVALNTSVSVTFSEAMGQGVTEAAFSSDPAIDCIFSWDAASAALSCKPTTELTANTTYTVMVGPAAQDLAGNGLETPVTFSFTTGQTSDTTPPAAPTGLAAEAAGNSVTLSWQGSSEEDLKSYKIYQGTSSGALSPIADVPAGTETYAAAGLENGTTYFFAVAAEDGAGNLSETSSEVSAKPVAQEGSFSIVINGLPAGSNADVTVAGPGGFSQTLSKTQTLTGLAPGSYSVTAEAVVGADTFGYSPNPAEQTAEVSVGNKSQIDVTYAISSGSLFLAVTGLSVQAEGDILVTGPGGFSQEVTSSTVLTNLEPGAYEIRSQDASSDDAFFKTTGEADQSVLVNQGSTTQVDISYACVRVIIQDSELAALVRDELNKPSGDLTCQDMAQLDELDEYDSEVTDLSGLQHAVNVVKLKLWGDYSSEKTDGIEDLDPLKTLTELEELDLYQNTVADLTPIANLTQLKLLRLYRNRVADLSPLAALTSLETLDLSDNELEGADLNPLANLTSLKWLSLNDGGISDITSLQSLTALEHLNLISNTVSNLAPLANAANLKVLYLHFNPVSDLSPLQNLTKLETLILSGNPVSDLSALSNKSALTLLYLSNTNITNASLADLAGLTSIETLLLSNNQLSSISPLNNLSSLETLYLDQTNVTDFSPLAGLPKLTGLSARNSGISSLSSLSGVTALQGLTLDNNAVENLSPLSSLSNLKSIDFGNNNVQSLSGLESLSKLTHLSLNDNTIEDLSPLSDLSELKFLYLTDNNIDDITALVDNTGIGNNDFVHLRNNCLDLSDGADDLADLNALEARGVNTLVYSTTQKSSEDCD